MNNLRNTFESGLQELRTMRDEIRVRLHLAGKEARDRWEKYLEPYVDQIESKIKDLSDGSMTDSVRDAIDRARAAFSEYRAQLLGNDQAGREPLRAVPGGKDTEAPSQSQSMPPSSGVASQSATSQGGTPTILTGGRTSDTTMDDVDDDDTPTLKAASRNTDTPGYGRTYGHVGSYHGQSSQMRSQGQELRQQQGMQATSTPGMQDDVDSAFNHTFDRQSLSQDDDAGADIGDDDDTLTSGSRPDSVAHGVDQGDLADSDVRGEQNGSNVASRRDRSAQRDTNRGQKRSSNSRPH